MNCNDWFGRITDDRNICKGPGGLMHLTCRNFGKPLTRECRLGDTSEHVEAGDREPTVPQGVIVRLSPDRAAELAPYIHVPFAVGAYSINPLDVIPRAVKSTGVDNGCCGSDGSDGTQSLVPVRSRSGHRMERLLDCCRDITGT